MSRETVLDAFSAAGPNLQRLNESVLQRGDVVLVTGRAATSAAIRLATRSDISHAMVCVEDRSVIDATDEGVHARNTQRLFLDAACPVYVLRLRAGISPAQLETVTQFLRRNIGTRYSVPEAMLAPVGGIGLRWTAKQFCSRLVAQAYAAAGIALVDDPNFCSPADIKTCKLLRMVPNPTVPVDEAEIAFWAAREDIPQRMRDVTNAVLSGARAISAEIESFEDLADFLLTRPEHDGALSGILERSGYLTLWAAECAKNPWQYDPSLMARESPEGMREYCAAVLANEETGPNRYVRNHAFYAASAASSGLRYFALMRGLHHTLAHLHRQRIDAARTWLREGNDGIGEEPPSPDPHTDAWFAALEAWDPPKAWATRAVLEATGRLDVCSVCGDDPASDYRLAEGNRPPAGVDTYRFCDDCRDIRLRMGEVFRPVR